MIHEVRVLNPKGKIKKLISSQELRQEHWRKFNDLSHEITIGKFSRGRVPRFVKQTLANEFRDHEEEYQ
ncbi:MAG: hypothetical protein O3A78_12690 [Nitrospinae bacterium]|nr:hypothetical protein [Nitrospinota bacterium]MDA1110645.1 hypothetical protein [Nitrospinota bacterium]